MTKTKTCNNCGVRFGPGKWPKNFWKQKCCSVACGHESRKGGEASFWAKVDKRGPDECWNWKASRRWDGYGRLQFNFRQTSSNRVAWHWANGPVPAGQLVLHRCDNRLCCNPAHLFLGTKLDNARDKVAKGRHVSILKPDDVREIRKLFGSMYQKDIAVKFGVSTTVISAIAKGRRWTHVQ